jgi:PAS domain S-box-containing protein
MDDNAEFILGESFATILTETTPSLVCVYDREARILLFNDACERATGFRREEVLGRDAREFVIPQEEREAFGDFLANVWRTGAPSPQVGHWRTKDGGRRLIAWSNRPMIGDDGEPATLVTTGIDLTDREPAQGEALQGDPEAKLVEVSRLASEQRALRRVATLVAREASHDRVFTAVSEECARVLQVNTSAVLRYDGGDTATVVGRTSRDSTDVFRIGETIAAARSSAVGEVLKTGSPARFDDWAEHGDEAFRVGYRSSAAAPIVVGGALWGAVTIASENPLPHDSEMRLGAFAELVSLAVASAQARADLIASRARLVSAGDEQRRRLERNLHDGAQQHLVAVALKLKVARAKLDGNPEYSAKILDDAMQELATGLEELRELARGLHPAILTDNGLAPALQALGKRLPIEVDLDVPVERLAPHLEATTYYIVSEALTNVVKHAGAGTAHVAIRQDGAMLRVGVTDDGRGGADAGKGSGIVGLRDRAEAAGGRITVVSPRGRGTVITAALPISA